MPNDDQLVGLRNNSSHCYNQMQMNFDHETKGDQHKMLLDPSLGFPSVPFETKHSINMDAFIDDDQVSPPQQLRPLDSIQ